MRTEMRRILASAAFADAERASNFLRFVVECALAGRLGEIKESVIGIEVLGRSPSFDPKTDPIVRVEAGRLRARLDSYYRNEGGSDAVFISLPKGRYVPEFSEPHLAAPRWTPARLGLLAAVGALVGFGIGALVFLSSHRHDSDLTGLRLSLLPPPGAEIEQSAISPDGRLVAFSANTGGKVELWARSLDSLAARPLPGTDEGAYPFWSPDGRSLGFVARTTLRKIDISGGPAETLANIRPSRGGAWGPSGIIIYAPRPLGVLYQIPAAGGTPKPVTSLDTTRGEIAHEFPQFLPDGRHFLYFAVSSQPGNSSIRVGSLDSGASKVLVNADASAAYAPIPGEKRGFLLFVYGGALLAQRFDPEKLSLSGERTVITPNILYNGGLADFSVSATGVLIYRAGSRRRQQFAWFDRQSKRLKPIGPLNNYYAWSLAPDEKHIAMMRVDPSGAGMSVWTADLASGASSRLINTFPGFAGVPMWSSDGSDILFSRGDEHAMSLQLEPLNAQAPTTVLDGSGPKFLSDWSSDRKFVAYYTPWPDWTKLNIFVAQFTNSGKLGLAHRPWASSYSEASACFSPAEDGRGPRWIAYLSDETGRDEIYVRDFPSGEHKWLISTAGGWDPQWRRDGRELFYLTLDGTLMAVSIGDSVHFTYGTPHPLFQTSVPPLPSPPDIPASVYAVSKDGKRFLINGLAPGFVPPPVTVVTGWQQNQR